VQIVDARNPLAFRCEDLEAYVREVKAGEEDHGTRKNLLLINKSDLLTPTQRFVVSISFSQDGASDPFHSAGPDGQTTLIPSVSPMLSSLLPTLSPCKRSRKHQSRFLKARRLERAKMTRSRSKRFMLTVPMEMRIWTGSWRVMMTELTWTP
jgi:hypothetical protein